MRTFTLLALVLSSLCALAQPHPYVPCEPDPLTGNTASVFDWRAPYYTMYLQSQSDAISVPSPFTGLAAAPTQLNTIDLAAFPPDFEPEDGWEVILVNFGTPSQKVSLPSLVLYNRLNGIMRILHYAKSDLDSYDSALLELKQLLSQDVFSKNSAIFEHMNTPMNALDNFSKQVEAAFPNFYQNVNLGNTDHIWLLGEILTAYDPCTCSHGTRIAFQPSFKNITEINLNIDGQSTTVPVFNAQTGPTGGVRAALAGAGGAVENFTKGAKTHKDLGTFTDILENLYPSLPFVPDNMPGLINSALNLVPGVGTAINMLDLFVPSSKAPSIASYDSQYTFEASGSLEKETFGIITSFRTPGAQELLNIPPDTEPVETIYDNPLGLFNLLNTPRVSRHYNYSGSLLNINLKLADDYDPQYVFNQAAGFSVEPSDVRFQLVFDDCSPLPPNVSGLSPTGVVGRYATPLMPIACLKDYTVNFSTLIPPSQIGLCSHPRLKVVANLKNQQTASESVYVASYVLEIEESIDPLPPNPYLDIPDIKKTNYEDFDPKKDLESWDQVIIKDVPTTILIDPQNPNVQTLLDVTTYDPKDVPVVGVFPGDRNETYDIIFQGVPPCPYTEPATAEEIADFCMNAYNPSAGLVDDEEPLSLQSAPAALPQPAEQPRIKLYPQPAGDWAQLELPDGQDRGRLLVMDAYGQTVLTQDIRSPHIQLNIATLPAGLYILSIDLLDGQPPYTERLAKQ